MDPRQDHEPAQLGGHRCSTLDGHPVEAREAVAQALIGHIRRVVVGADGVVIDLGRLRRTHTGSAQLAVRLSSMFCYWPGCNVRVTDCQTDHLTPWARHGGRTDPGNGAPCCGRHNRFKEHGHTVRRGGDGRMHVYRPDGTELP
ncbi:MAG: HNH endonuclease signature motif containing protein [Acidimicrobiales bacterium]